MRRVLWTSIVLMALSSLLIVPSVAFADGVQDADGMVATGGTVLIAGDDAADGCGAAPAGALDPEPVEPASDAIPPMGEGSEPDAGQAGPADLPVDGLEDGSLPGDDVAPASGEAPDGFDDDALTEPSQGTDDEAGDAESAAEPAGVAEDDSAPDTAIAASTATEEGSSSTADGDTGSEGSTGELDQEAEAEAPVTCDATVCVTASVSAEPSASASVIESDATSGTSANEEAIAVLAAALGLDEFSSKDAIDLVAKLVGSAATLDPGEVAGAVVEWGMTQLLSAIFGVPMDDDASLQEILQNIKELQNGLDTLQKTVNSQELDQILNDLKVLLAEQTSYDVYNGLKDVDAKHKAGTYSDDEAAQRRKSELTGSLGVTDNAWESVNNTFDRFVLQLWTAMTETYYVTIDGKNQDLSLMQVYYEHLRMKHHWENQAYDEWAAFQARCVGLLTTSLTLEKSSLQARIDLLKEWNKDPSHAKRDEGACVSRLKTIQDYINQVSGYTGKDPYGKDVDYAGLFSEKTWAAQYWMYKERPDYRYYWTPGHEILFHAAVNTQNVPQETKGKGSTSTSAKGFTYPGHHKHVVTFKFWKPFIRYHGGNTLLVSYDQLKDIYADYNAKGATASLLEIFMGDGAFTGLSGTSTNWQFVIDCDSKHPLTYEEHTFKADQIYCYRVDGMKKATSIPGASHLILCYYHYFSNEPNTGTNYIGIGVARVGPETYDPDAIDAPEMHTALISDPALWWTSAGDLLLAYDHNEQGGLNRVLLDGRVLYASSYIANGGQVLLDDEYLSTLPYGEHTLMLDTVGGSHAIVFRTQADGAYHVVAGDGATWNKGVGDGLAFTFKRTVDDSITFMRLVGVLVDGAAIPSWAYSAKAGSAIITLSAKFLETLAPGAHMLTAVFEDGNDPQAHFTVRTGTTPQPQPQDYTDEGMWAKGTPATGDGVSPAVLLLACLALASGCLAMLARSKRAHARYNR